MKVTVDKCPWTGKLFENPSKYAAHLKEQRQAQRHKREKARLAVTFNEFLKPLYQLDTTDAIAAWLTENYMKVALHFGPRWERKKPYYPGPEDRVEIEIPVLKFKQECSTTHSSPIGQKNTGWGKDTPHIPEPGWSGKIIMRPKGNAYKQDLVDSDYLKKIGINTGSGGGGPDKLTYELTLFTKDFPGLRRRAAAHVILQNHGQPGIDSNGEILQKDNRLFG